jgi:hypothetical protein
MAGKRGSGQRVYQAEGYLRRILPQGGGGTVFRCGWAALARRIGMSYRGTAEEGETAWSCPA